MRGSIVKRGKKYSIIINLGRDYITGKRKQKWFSGYNTKKEAEKDLPKLLLKAENGTLIPSNNMNLENFLKEWLKEHSKKQDLSPTTVDGYNNIIFNHIIPYLGNLKLQDIKTYNIQKYFDYKFETLSAKTLTQHYRVLSGAFNYAKKMNLMEYNPCKNIERPKEKQKDTRVLTIEECKLLLLKLKNNPLEVPVTLALLLGLRRGEALGLRWIDINFKDKIISINQTLEKVKGEFIFKEPKTKKSKRKIAVTDDILEMLKKHKKSQLLSQIKTKDKCENKYDLICTRNNGSPITPTVLSTQFNKFLIKNKLPIIRFHDLRHTNATMMLSLNIPAKIAGSRLGHSNIKTTLDLYSHVLESVDREVAEKINNVLSI